MQVRRGVCHTWKMPDTAVCPFCGGQGARVLTLPNGVQETEVCLCQQSAERAPEVCPSCDGLGMRIVTQPDGRRFAEECECRHERKMHALLRKAQIPKRYETCTMSTFKRSGENLTRAFNMAQEFAEKYPVVEEGLLFTGSVGVGKTHLAVAILQRLTLRRGIAALFCDYRELLKQITNSYNARSEVRELDLFRPVFDSEVLVLDELGAVKPTEWVSDTVALILNTRYNNKRTTIVTTNYANLPAGASSADGLEDVSDAALTQMDAEGRGREPKAGFRRSAAEPMSDAAIASGWAVRRETLGDRIGDRMWSRLQEMCVAVEMRGADYRLGAKRARFS